MDRAARFNLWIRLRVQWREEGRGVDDCIRSGVSIISIPRIWYGMVWYGMVTWSYCKGRREGFFKTERNVKVIHSQIHQPREDGMPTW